LVSRYSLLPQKLFAKLPCKWRIVEIEEAGHNNIEYADDYLDAFLAFIDFLGKARPDFLPAVLAPKPVPSTTHSLARSLARPRACCSLIVASLVQHRSSTRPWRSSVG